MTISIFSLMSRTTGRRVLALVTALALVLMASNPELAPLVALIDAIGLDVLVLLLGAQLLATLPWLSVHLRRDTRLATRVLVALAAGAMGGYLRQLVFGGGIRSAIASL